MGREEEGSSSNQPELVAYLLALSNTLIKEPLLYLCDNHSFFEAVNRWIGEGGKATLVGHLTRIFWQQLSRYFERGLQQGQQPSWSK